MSKASKQLEKIDFTDQDVWAVLLGKVGQIKTFLIGLVMLVGSMGLLMGAITCAIASVALVKLDPSSTFLPLVIAMLIGFFSAAVLAIIVAVIVIKKGIPK